MIRKCMLPVALIAASLTLGGCDFMRTVAGRPTSDVIEAKRAEIAAEEQRIEAEREAAEAARRHEAALAEAERYVAENCMLVDASRIKSLDTATLKTRYAVIVGAFSQEGNAEAFASKLDAMGYDSGIIHYRNGHQVVGVCLTDDVIRLAEMYPKVKAESFCPPEVWILVNNQ